MELAERLQDRTPLRARLQMDRGAIDVQAQVVWAGEPAPTGGVILHGVAFAEVTPEQYQALQALLLFTGEMWQAGGSVCRWNSP